MPLANTRPISNPIRNSINTSTKKPTTVVRLLAKIELIAWSMALVRASSSLNPLLLSRSKASSRKME